MAHATSKDTTPPVADHLPLSPPLSTDKSPSRQVSAILCAFEELDRGTIPSSDSHWPLSTDDYLDLDCRLQTSGLAGFVQDKIRYDYDADSKLLTIRMPTSIHEYMIQRINEALVTRLAHIGQGAPSRTTSFAKAIKSGGSADVSLERSGSRSKRSPDASYRHPSADHPGVIVEVAYSQKHKNLSRLAEQYLLDSDNNIQCVVGIDIGYSAHRQPQASATLSVWKARIEQNAGVSELRAVRVSHEPFRDDHRQPTDSAGLCLLLSDFAYEEIHQNLPDGCPSLHISSRQLCGYLDEAERDCGDRHIVKHVLGLGVQKRRRSSSPPEVLDFDEVLVTADHADSDYVPSPGST